MQRVLLSLISCLLFACQSQFFPKDSPKVEQGVFDLRKVSLAQNELLELKGEWLCKSLSSAIACQKTPDKQYIPFSTWRSYQQVQQDQSLHVQLSVDIYLADQQNYDYFLNFRDIYGPYKVSIIELKQGSIVYQSQVGEISSIQSQSIPTGDEIWARLSGFEMRIGIHHGSAIVGSFGGKRSSDYTAIGNTVNIASRVEALAGPGQILLTAAVRDYLDEKSWSAAGSHRLKGVENEIQLYTLNLKDVSDVV